jgi:hypothetical protein
MVEQDSLDYLMQRRYDVSMNEIDGKIWMEIEELKLVVEGPSVEDAYANLNAAKRQLFDHYSHAGKLSKIPLPQADKEAQVFRTTMKPFIAKASIAALIGVLFIVAANVSVFYVLETAPQSVVKKAGRAALKNLQYFASKEMTPKKEQKLRIALRGAVARLQPFSNELAPLFTCKPPSSGG